MIPIKEYEGSKKRSLEILKKNHIFISKDEIENFEIADFGLNNHTVFGIQTFVLINTDNLCLKIIVLFPFQICPEHKHNIIENGKQLGKEENLRILEGQVLLYREGLGRKTHKVVIPSEKKKYFTSFKELVLKKGMKVIIPSDTWHWFQAGPQGAIIENLSTKAIDEKDLFRDPSIIRKTVII